MLSKRLIMLASTLLKTLSDTSHNADARDLANKLLERLLRTFPSLTWDADLLTAFLTSLDAPVDCDYPVSPDARLTVHLRRVTCSTFSRPPPPLLLDYAPLHASIYPSILESNGSVESPKKLRHGWSGLVALDEHLERLLPGIQSPLELP